MHIVQRNKLILWPISNDSSLLSSASNILLGDGLVLISATLYAVSNVCQEYTVKNLSRVEFLGMVGLFGTIISTIQMCVKCVCVRLFDQCFESFTIWINLMYLCSVAQGCPGAEWSCQDPVELASGSVFILQRNIVISPPLIHFVQQQKLCCTEVCPAREDCNLPDLCAINQTNAG